MNTLTIAGMCRLLEVDRRRFYKWRASVAADPSPRQQRAAELTAKIRAFHAASDGTYGAPRIHADLKNFGVLVSGKTVAKLMRAHGITGISPATWHPPSTVRGQDPFPVPDLVQRRFDQGERDLVWFSDIICLHTGQGWAYLCVVRDGDTRCVLGRTVVGSLDTGLVEDALRQAVALRGCLPCEVIFHADRGKPSTPAFSWRRPRPSSECCGRWAAPGSAGITHPRNRSGQRLRTSTTTGTCLCHD